VCRVARHERRRNAKQQTDRQTTHAHREERRHCQQYLPSTLHTTSYVPCTYPLLLHTHARTHTRTHAHTHTQPFNGPLSGTTRASRYQKVKTNLDFTEARDSEWQWNQLGRMQVSTSLQTDNHASTPPCSCLQAGCPSCRPTNSIKALQALLLQ